MPNNLTQSEITHYNQGVTDTLKLIEARSQHWNTTYEKDDLAYEVAEELNKIKSTLLEMFK